MRLTVVFAFILIAKVACAQQLEYQVRFFGFGDNREFKSNKAMSHTMLGERTSGAIGTTLEGHHRLRVGVDHLLEFGAGIEEHTPKLIAYYNYQDDRKAFYFGAFPRLGLIDFPLAMLADTLNYYRPNIEGLYGRYNWKWGYQYGFVDWTSRQTATRRETFLAALSGEMRYRSFFFQNFMTLFHRAGTSSPEDFGNVIDDLGIALYAGFNLEKAIPLRKAYVKAGIIESSNRQRGGTDEFVNTLSFIGELYGEGRHFALKTVVHQGEGHNFLNGDRFFDVGDYIRTDIIWKFVSSAHVQGRFNLSFHVVGGALDQSQQLSLIYNFGNAD